MKQFTVVVCSLLMVLLAGQVDFAHFRLPWGRRWALLVLLSYSQLLWLRFFQRQTMHTLFSGLEQAFACFGGVPREVLFDQMKAVILEDQRLASGPLLENLEFLCFAHHWQFRPRACRSYRAKTKGKVERPIHYLRENFFYGRSFLNDEDLEAQAQRWLAEVAKVRVPATTGERPLDRFQQEEQTALIPLAARPYHSLLLPLVQDPPAALKLKPRLQVERRALEVYSQLTGSRS